MSRLAIALGAAVAMSASSMASAETLNEPGNLCKPVSGTGSAFISYPFSFSGPNNNSIQNNGTVSQDVVCPLPRAFFSNNTTEVALGASAGTFCFIVSTNGFTGQIDDIETIFPGQVKPIFAPFDAVLSLRCTLPGGGRIFGYADQID